MSKLARLGGAVVLSWLVACSPSDGGEVVSAPTAEAQSGCEMVFRVPRGSQLPPEEHERVADAIYERVTKLEPKTIGVVANATEILVRVTAPPSLSQIEAYRARIEHLGAVRFSRLAETGPSKEQFVSERKKMREWRAANPTGRPEDYQAVPPDQGGPVQGVRWFLQRAAPEEWLACDVTGWSDPATSYTESDLDWKSIQHAKDLQDRQALAASLKPERAEAFQAFTTELAKNGEMLAILNDDRVVLSAPLVNEALKGPFVVEGWFDEADLATAVDAWRSGARAGRLPFRPEFVAVR